MIATPSYRARHHHVEKGSLRHLALAHSIRRMVSVLVFGLDKNIGWFIATVLLFGNIMLSHS